MKTLRIAIVRNAVSRQIRVIEIKYSRINRAVSRARLEQRVDLMNRLLFDNCLIGKGERVIGIGTCVSADIDSGCLFTITGLMKPSGRPNTWVWVR